MQAPSNFFSEEFLRPDDMKATTDQTQEYENVDVKRYFPNKNLGTSKEGESVISQKVDHALRWTCKIIIISIVPIVRDSRIL